MSVTDMLIAILNCCTKEELEEEEETPMITPESPELDEEEGKLPQSADRVS
jgi:serine/threonine-protein phosphatase 2B catalytic subunit